MSSGTPIPTGAINRRGPFRPGERVQITDERGRITTITLAEGGEYHSHKGFLKHDDLIGAPEGTVIANTHGILYQALRPLYKDFVLSMPRGAAVVYPKDAAQIIVKADIFPGARVVEAGVGSGALSIALLRAVGDYGCVHSFERREEFADVARGNIETMFGGPHPAWKLSIGDLRLDGRFTEPECDETIVRGWHVEGLAVRPDHRMVAHTAFLIVARRLADGAVRLAPKRRASKTDFSEEDMNAWIPMNVGEREVTDKKIRRAARDAKNLAAHAARANEIALEQNGTAQNGLEPEKTAEATQSTEAVQDAEAAE